MIIAPTEPPRLRQLGTVKLTPESYGADILFTANSKLVGIQRKDYNDLLSSLFQGDRIYKELLQMKRLDIAALIIEGTPHFNSDGIFYNPDRRTSKSSGWTRMQHFNFITAVQSRGYFVMQTVDLDDTIDAIASFKSWLNKDGSSLLSRPKPKGEWGRVTNVDYALHLLQSFKHIGPKQARSILKHFGGVPLRWTCTEAEMNAVAGIGPKITKELFSSLPSPEAKS